MDEIENFLLHQNFNVSILLRVYDRLRQFSFISEVNLYTLILSCAGDKPNFSRHLKAYASLVIVSSMVPSLSLNRKVNINWKNVLKCIIFNSKFHELTSGAVST